MSVYEEGEFLDSINEDSLKEKIQNIRIIRKIVMVEI